MNGQRDAVGDIAKAIGVIFIVLGHCWYMAVPYVYTCHLAIFFLVLGYFYNDEKYSGGPFNLMASRLKGMLPKYLFYLFLFIILHNVFINMGIYSWNVPYYPSYGAILLAMVNAVFFDTFEFMASAMWFIPMLLVGTAILGCVFYLSNKYSFNSTKRRNWMLCISFVMIGMLGLYLNNRKSELLFHAQTSIILIPVAYAGFLLKKYKQMLKWITWYGACLCLIFIIFILNTTGSMIELSADSIISVYLFYPVTLAGLYISIWLIKLISKSKLLAAIFSYIGKLSFDIMALHFLFFKLADYFYIHIFNLPMDKLGKFPTSYPALWLIYALSGIVFPVLLVTIYQFMKRWIHLAVGKVFQHASPNDSISA